MTEIGVLRSSRAINNAPCGDALSSIFPVYIPFPLIFVLFSHIFLFKPPGFLAFVGSYVFGILALSLAEAVLIAWLLFTQIQRSRTQRDSQRFAAIAEAERLHVKEIVSNVPGIVWETHLDPDIENRKTKFISSYVETMLGYTPEEWLSSEPGLGLRLIPDDAEREAALQASLEVLKTANETTIQHRWKAKDGRILWIESYLCPIFAEAGKVIGLRGISFDITEKKTVEDAKRQSEQTRRAILQAMPDLMFLQTAEGVYIDYHASSPDLLKAPPEEFLGKNMREVLPTDLAEDISRCFERILDTCQPQTIEYELTLADGTRSFEARVVQAGENFLSVIRDITERKLAEEELRKSEANYRAIFDAASDAIFVHDPETGELLDVNQRMCEMYGITAEEAPFIRINDFSSGEPPFVEKTGLHLLKAAAAGEPQLFEWRAKDKSGRLFWVEVNLKRVHLKGRNVLLAVVRDISERKKAEEELRQSESRFRNMADSAPVMIWVAGVDKGFTYFNKQWLDYTGRSFEHEKGEGWTAGIHREDYDQCLEVYNSCFDRREPFRMEYRLRRADGSYRWIYDTGTPRFSSTAEFLGYIGSCVDIEDRKASEKALTDALEELKRMKNQLHEENIYLREEIELEHNHSDIVGQSDAIKYVLHKIEQVAPTDSTVLITGDTGTGKELVARAIHSESKRSSRPLIKVNCAALSASLIESELFGHEKGAFTGALNRKAGRFELADGATLFLDEIGELSTDLQVKLLRVIQEGEFERLGSNRTIKANVRIIAATNRNLWDEVQQGRFREDLWYRLNVFPITVPPLRQRPDDVPLLVEHFVARVSKKIGRRITSISPGTLHALSIYSWPGNIRELANVIERAVINNSGEILHIPKLPETTNGHTRSFARKTLEEMEKEYIANILASTDWRIEGPTGSARILGLHPSTLRTRIAKLKIDKPK